MNEDRGREGGRGKNRRGPNIKTRKRRGREKNNISWEAEYKSQVLRKRTRKRKAEER
jgi:hypothetical protein